MGTYCISGLFSFFSESRYTSAHLEVQGPEAGEGDLWLNKTEMYKWSEKELARGKAARSTEVTPNILVACEKFILS